MENTKKSEERKKQILNRISRRNIIKSMVWSAPSVIAVSLPVHGQSSNIPCSQHFSANGAAATSFTVPSDVIELFIALAGASGGQGGSEIDPGGKGGAGAIVQGTISVTPGDNLLIYTGFQGTNGSSSVNHITPGPGVAGGPGGDGYGKGGAGGSNTGVNGNPGQGQYNTGGGGGGGSSAILLNNNISLIAGSGGGGGGGQQPNGASGGPGADGGHHSHNGGDGNQPISWIGANNRATGGSPGGSGIGGTVGNSVYCDVVTLNVPGANGDTINGGLGGGAANLSGGQGGGGGGAGHGGGGGGGAASPIVGSGGKDTLATGAGGGGGGSLLKGVGVAYAVVTGDNPGDGYATISWNGAKC